MILEINCERKLQKTQTWAKQYATEEIKEKMKYLEKWKWKQNGSNIWGCRKRSSKRDVNSKQSYLNKEEKSIIKLPNLTAKTTRERSTKKI